MPKRLEITLSQQQRAELLQARDHHSKAYVREKAAAILKIADERLPALQVASHRLLKRRDDNTVRSWLRRYLQGGLAGLLVQKGRGKKPAFSPSGRPKRRQCPRDTPRDKQRGDQMVGVISREEGSQDRETTRHNR